MDFEALVHLTGTLPCFDLALLVQAFDDRREHILVQLSRWMAQGKVIGLRRGMYALGATHRHAPVHPAALANQLCQPSYLSGLWALGFYDLIPERVVWLTSVTPRPPQRFENPFGLFEYRSLKQEFFFGYRTASQGGASFRVADPEKALLDHWHLTPGEWTLERMEGMHYQNAERIDRTLLTDQAKRFNSPRLNRALGTWLQVIERESEGTETL